MRRRIAELLIVFVPLIVTFFAATVFAERTYSGGGMGTAIALGLAILGMMGSLFLAWLGLLFQASLRGPTGPTPRQLAQAPDMRRLYGGLAIIGSLVTLVCVVALVGVHLPSSLDGQQIAWREEEPAFLAMMMLHTGLIWLVGGWSMAHNERKLAQEAAATA